MSTVVRHRAAGLVIAADRPLPGFAAAANDDAIDVHLHLEDWPTWREVPSQPVYSSDDLDACGLPVVRVSRSPEGFHFQYADQTRIWIDQAGMEVWTTWPASASLDDTCTYLCGPALSLLLRLRGALALHASAVAIAQGAIGLVGPHGAGKSTLAAALGASGCAVLTDDVLHLRREGTTWMAEPFATMVKLWPDGAELALGAGAELPLVTAGWDKRALYLGEGVRASTSPAPLLALGWLAPRGEATEIAPMSPGHALVQFAANSSAAHLLDRAARAVEFSALGDLVRSVPCFAITPPCEAGAFPAFVARLHDWAGALRPLE